jgi:hypothetical protein
LHKSLVCARFNIEPIIYVEANMELLIATHSSYGELCNGTIATEIRALMPTTLEKYLSYRLKMGNGKLSYQGFACGFIEANFIAIVDYPLPVLYDDFSHALIQYSNSIQEPYLSLYNPFYKKPCPPDLMNKVMQNWA